MPLSNASETAILQLILQNVSWSTVGSGLPGASTAGNFYLALHTASPGLAGGQNTNEALYTGYARVAIARTSAAWQVAGNNPAVASNLAPVTFPQATGGSETETWASVGTAATGAGQIFLFGQLAVQLPVSSGVIPSFQAGQVQLTAV